MRCPQRFFDAIFALEGLEHVAPSKIFNSLEKMRNNPSGHTRTYTENLIRAELKIAGFKILKLKTLYAFKSFYGFKKISSKILRNRWKPNDIVVLAKIA